VAGSFESPDKDPAPPGACLYVHDARWPLHLGGALPGFRIAYETWGELSPARDNAILLFSGLSASSHARSSAEDPRHGWWETMIGPGLPIDTNRFFVVCCNVLGGCFGSTGPSSSDPRTGHRYALEFPLVTIWDFAATQARVLDHLGIDCLDAAVGSSMGGMQVLAFAAAFPERVRRIVAISTPGRSYPLSIALRFVQRQAVMRDPEWKGGYYYPGAGPEVGLHLARQIGTITYRSGPEWDRRFARERAVSAPTLTGSDFQIESYLVHQGDRFVGRYDANSYLFISKAMDLFDLGDGAPSYDEGVARIRAHALIVGVTTDLLFPVHQQEELARILREWGRDCRFLRIDSVYGHDAFLIDIDRFGRLIRAFLDEPAPPQRRPRSFGDSVGG
jgi:homoserine O-acetyltransferase